MTVSELINELGRLPGNMQVILQKDPEGNGYSPLSGADSNAIYVPHEETVYDAEWSSGDALFDSESEWEDFKNQNPRCCVLFPEN